MKNLLFGTILAFSAVQISNAAELTIPHTFSAGTKTSAAEMNENFDAVADTISQNQVGVAISVDPNFTGIAEGDDTLTQVDTVTVTVPSTGYIIVTHSGTVTLFGEPNTINIGIGETELAMDTSVRVGHLDGSSTDRYRLAYSATNRYTVSAPGSYTFYGLAQKSLTFDAGAVNVVPQSLTALFVPNEF